MSPEAASEDEIGGFLKQYTAWHLEGGKLQREFVFSNFVQAFGYMTRVALVAERLNHHPDWSNSYNTVQVTLASHDAGAITALDFSLAEAMEEILAG